jgi:hypothetical protein
MAEDTIQIGMPGCKTVGHQVSGLIQVPPRTQVIQFHASRPLGMEHRMGYLTGDQGRSVRLENARGMLEG